MLIHADVRPRGRRWTHLIVEVVYSKCLERKTTTGKHNVAGIPISSNRRFTEAGGACLAGGTSKVRVGNICGSWGRRCARRLRQQLRSCGVAIAIRTDYGRKRKGCDSVSSGRRIEQRYDLQRVRAIARSRSVCSVRIVDLHVPIALRLQSDFDDVWTKGCRRWSYR